MSLKKFDQLIGQTFAEVRSTGDEMLFILPGGGGWKFYHEQDCCEIVTIEDVIGDLDDLAGSAIIEAEEISNEGAPVRGGESYTWTFYRFSTIKGTVTVRWLGESHGFYYESVNFAALPSTVDPSTLLA